MSEILEAARQVQERVNPHGFVVMVDDTTDNIMVVGGHMGFAITRYSVLDGRHLDHLDMSIVGLKKAMVMPMPDDWKPLRWGGEFVPRLTTRVDSE